MFPSSDASLTGFLMLFRTMLHDFVPVQLRSYFSGLLERFFTPKSKNLTVVIDEKFKNKVFHAAEMYLRKKMGPEIYFIIHSKKIRPETERVRAGKTPKQKHLTVKEKRSWIRSRRDEEESMILML
ncbi:hypothetical protein IGI04_031981 [Brassica rapa subsp. trilocularis]|uniref:AAA-type ATPase N-terminal domain-containing protein n=1 Tax=Brassica rapa subsp. trilocularis TaxID=1813537 RepID=A0ABQ7LWN2_BRACM|nr:hypothetical protein IGI04_031981 [Brassica rapa subsp. trilocularis]